MHRRSYLALATGALSTAIPTSLAGCTSSPGGSNNTTASTTPPDSTTTTSTTTTSDLTTQTEEPATVKLRDALVQPGVVLLQTDYLTVAGQGGQYLLVDVAVTDGEAPRNEYRVQFHGQSSDPMPQRETRRLWRVYNQGDYDPATGGLLVFQLPESATSNDPEALFEVGSWKRELPPAVQTNLATPNPSFLVDATVTSPIEVGQSPRVTVRIENTSDVAGRFVAGLNRSGPSVAMMPVDRISRPVEPGTVEEYVHESPEVTGSNVPDENRGDGETDLQFYLNTLNASRQLGVEADASTD